MTLRTMVLGLLLLAMNAGCGSGRRVEPLVGPVRLTTAAQQHGQVVFFRNCDKCHPGGDAGLGPAINNKPLPGAAIKLQVRTGVGAMPSFNDDRISDADLDGLIAYLDAVGAPE